MPQSNTTNTVFNNGLEAYKFLNIPHTDSPNITGLLAGALNYFPTDDKVKYWDGTQFQDIATDVDLSGYYTKIESDERFYPLSTNPAGYLTSFTEVDPTVPNYAKTLSAFSVIKTSTDVLYPSLTGSYADPSWITSLAYAKLTGAPNLGVYVPYNGATEAVDLGAFDLTVNSLTVGIGGGSEFSTAIGQGALVNSDEQDNTAVGYFSGVSLIGGTGNTSLGFRTLASIVGADENTAVGHTALRDATTGNRNTAIGYRAMYDIVNPGDDITLVGSYTSILNTPLSNASAFGAEAIIGESNKIQLGNTDVAKLGIGNTTFTGANGTAKTFALPSATSGTIALISDIPSLTGYAPLESPTFTGTVVLPSTTSIGSVSNTELSYLDGVTSSIQTQLNGKQSALNGTGYVSQSGTTTSFITGTINDMVIANGTIASINPRVRNVTITTVTPTNTAIANGDMIQTIVDKTQGQLNAKQATLNGTGFVKASGTTISYDNSTYLTSAVTSVTSANTDIGVATTTTTPVLTLNSGSGANQIVKRDGSGNITAPTFNGNLTATTATVFTIPSGSTDVVRLTDLNDYVTTSTYQGISGTKDWTGENSFSNRHLLANSEIVGSGSGSQKPYMLMYPAGTLNVSPIASDLYVASGNFDGLVMYAKTTTNSTANLSWKIRKTGSTDLADYGGTLIQTPLTADREWTLPNTSGTIALTSNLSGYVTISGDDVIGGYKSFTNYFTGPSIYANITTNTGDGFMGVARGFLTVPRTTDFTAPDNSNMIIYASPSDAVVGNAGNSIRIKNNNVADYVPSQGKYVDLISHITANRQLTIPDANGTIALTSDVPIAGSFSGVGTATTIFTVTIGQTMANTTYKVNVTPTSALSAAMFYVTSKTTTTFNVVYLAGLTGTVTFDWSVFK